MLEDTKKKIRSRKHKKDRNHQKKNNSPQNTIHIELKTKK